MGEVNVKDARIQLSALLDRVEKGEEIVIKRRGKRVAKMVPPGNVSYLPSLKDFRASLKVRGKPLSQTVIDTRKEERY
jgi:prevent-host-death family protein